LEKTGKILTSNSFFRFESKAAKLVLCTGSKWSFYVSDPSHALKYVRKLFMRALLVKEFMIKKKRVVWQQWRLTI